MPPTQLATDSSKEDLQLYHLTKKQTLAKAQWLISEYQLHLALNQSSYRTPLTPLYLKHYKLKQQHVSEKLLIYASNALNLGNTQIASTLLQTLHQLQLPILLQQPIDNLTLQLSNIQEIALLNKQQKLENKLDQSIQKGQLIKTHQLINQLKLLKHLSDQLLAKIQLAEDVISHNAKILNEQANTFYQEGSIQLAISLWGYLLKFSPDNYGVNEKLSRSIRVINNMKQLRQKKPDPDKNAQ